MAGGDFYIDSRGFKAGVRLGWVQVGPAGCDGKYIGEKAILFRGSWVGGGDLELAGYVRGVSRDSLSVGRDDSQEQPQVLRPRDSRCESLRSG